MKAIPLIQKADVQSINTSIIALKEAQKELETLNIQVNRKISDLNKLLDGLDVAEIGGSGKLIQSIKQTDGKISATTVDLTSTIASGNNQPATSGGVADAIEGNTIYNPCYNNVDSLFDIDTVGAGHRTYASVGVGGGTSGSCPSDFGVVYTIAANGTAWKFQIAKETYSDTTYTRQNINNGGWSAWQKVFTNGNFTMMSPWNNVHRFTMTKDKFYLLFTGNPNFPNSGGGMNMYLVMAPHSSIAELTGYVEEIKVIQTSTTVSINGDDIVISSPNYSVAVLMLITN